MSKKQRKVSSNQRKQTTDDSATSLSDLMSEDMLAKLKGMKQEMKVEEEIKLEQEKEKRIQERKEREKNKSFEELLEEYGYDGTKHREY
ncbi:DUF3886 domain-containing protein [Sporosarcina sp. P21c]|uniref:YqkE family protein n=1 Tax=Sporosarcina TaxID=1569 RepID=UPI000A164E8E|nr:MULTISPECIES: YqkE family protein [Sporosarcina]ARJ40117.1 hypothetical protein SporoP8_15230 [Sporosarcina ureae]PIC68686.1 DUF3886 domain-containing protein [Sporosarcina sp. P16a]PIC91130.1 DUF3886 domain-containing protein [Sporosarcina sp. P21c]PIC93738.1 DUF3886 domain-containing protein [Sporosarcina sp. P25]